MNYPNAIEQAEKEIQRDKDDLKRLKKRYPGYDFVKVDTLKKDVQTPSVDNPSGDLAELDRMVLAVISMAPQMEWTSRSILEQLKAVDYRLPEKEDAAMNAIGASCATLVGISAILRSHEGRGRDPHRYTALPEAVEKEADSEEKTS